MASAREKLQTAAAESILIKDGPYGTAIQNAKLTAEKYAGNTGLTQDQKGNNDLVNLTQPQVIRSICDQYIASGATVLATNTFNANRISQADYGAEGLVREINISAARIIRETCDEATAKDGKPRFVCGAMGPTNKTLSLSPNVEDPGFREVTFDEVKDVYREQAAALIEGGADFILIETVFDSLNCSFGAEQLRPHVKLLSGIADTLLMAYPNAGLPNELGEYDELPDTTASLVRQWADSGQVNILGGCCGNTPQHIGAMAKAVEGLAPREVPKLKSEMRLAGLEPFTIAA